MKWSKQKKKYFFQFEERRDENRQTIFYEHGKIGENKERKNTRGKKARIVRAKQELKENSKKSKVFIVKDIKKK